MTASPAICRAVATTYSTMGLPRTSCNTLAFGDFMRLPSPAARMTTVMHFSMPASQRLFPKKPEGESSGENIRKNAGPPGGTSSVLRLVLSDPQPHHRPLKRRLSPHKIDLLLAPL